MRSGEQGAGSGETNEGRKQSAVNKEQKLNYEQW